MPLEPSTRSITYAPLLDEFAREVSDEDPDRIDTDPVSRSTALRQAADLVDPDWVVVTDSGGLASPEAAVEEPDAPLEFGEPAVADLAEVVGILAEIRTEPIVAHVPDPVSLALETFGERWTSLLDSDDYAALDVLHGASQLLSDVLRSFDGTCDGLVLDATSLPAVAGKLSLDDYLFETGPVFNVADHHNVSVLGVFPATYVDEYDPLAEAFDFVVFDSLAPAGLDELTGLSPGVGCSFDEAFWDAADGDTFRQHCEEYLDAVASTEILLLQPIPGTVEPEFVQILGDELESRTS